MTEELKNNLEAEIQSVEYFIEKSPNTGEYTLALKKDNKKQYILSKYKPCEHAIKQLKEKWGNKDTVWILIGYGFGYMAEAILEKVGNDTCIIIIEPNEKLLYEQKKLVSLRKEATNIHILSENNLDSVKLQEELDKLIPDTEMYNINIHYLEGYLNYYKSYCKYIIDEISNVKLDKEINFYTKLFRKKDNNMNCLRNARYLSKNNDIYHLQKICKDVPALIVCAGPSLEKNIDEIKNFKGIIIAIGRTITPLMERGIRPDFIVNIDPTDIIYETFDKFKENDIPLVTLVDANAKVVSNNYGEKYLLYNDPIITHIFKTRVNPTTALSKSVSTLCLSFSEFLGCNPIIIVGQDLAYTENKVHINEETSEKIDTDPAKTFIKGYDGELVKSSTHWVVVIKWIEAQVRKYSDIIHINATEGGAYIDGLIHIPLKEAIQKYCKKDKPKITHVRLEISKEIDYKRCIEETKKSLEKIQRLLKMIMINYKQLEKEYAKNDKKNWNKIAQLHDNIATGEKSIKNISNSENLIELLSQRVDMVLDTDNENKKQIDTNECEEDIRIMRYMKEKYYYLSKECDNFINIINKVREE